MNTYVKFTIRWVRRVTVGVMGLLILSCSSDHESGNDHKFETEFEKNYRAIAQQKTTNQQRLNELTALKKSNFDAYRSIAFTWHSAAMEACQQTVRREQFATPKSSYQQLLESDRQSTLNTISIDSETRECIQKFFTRNWENINTMIRLN